MWLKDKCTKARPDPNSASDDYRKLFNEDPPHVKGIRIQTNSQHTESIGEGYFGKIVFSKNLAVAR